MKKPLYLRQLLRVHWITDSWDVDAASTGSYFTLELHRPPPAPEDGGGWRVGGRAAPSHPCCARVHAHATPRRMRMLMLMHARACPKDRRLID